MVEASTIIAIVITAITIAAIGFFIYNRRFRGRGRPFFRSGSRPYGRKTPEGEPLEEYNQGRKIGSFVRVAIPVIIGIIVLVVVLSASIKIVDAGHRGVLLNFGAVDTSVSLNEGIHFVTPFRDNVVPLEVRTQKIVESAASASKDLQEVSTQVALNYHVNPDTAQILYQQLGLEYSARVINPAIQESVKQVTARFNAEELITKRETVKTEIDQQLRDNPRYLEWLKTQQWDGVLPLVTGGDGATPFIQIPSGEDSVQAATTNPSGNSTGTGNATQGP